MAITGSAGVVSTGGVLNITDTSTLSLPWTYTATDPGKRFVVQNTGTLLFSSNTSTSGGIGDSIGTLMPGGTLRLANGLGTLTLNRGTVSGLVLGVVETDYPELGTAAFSSASTPYTIDVGNNTLQVGGHWHGHPPDRRLHTRGGPAHAGGLRRRRPAPARCPCSSRCCRRRIRRPP